MIGLLRFGCNIKFYCAPFFLANLFAGFLAGSESDIPVPEKATYAGGGGGVYFYDVLSLKLTDKPPFGYFYLSLLGIIPLLRSFINYLFFG